MQTIWGRGQSEDKMSTEKNKDRDIRKIINTEYPSQKMCDCDAIYTVLIANSIPPNAAKNNK